MSKITLTFDSYEDSDELRDALNGTKNAAKLEEIWMKCFRPAFKHGYDSDIQKIIDMDIMEFTDEHGDRQNHALDLIEKLGFIYLRIQNDED